MPDVTKTAKDALYVTVGLGVIGLQKAQVRRREIARQVETQLSETSEQLQKLARQVQEQLDPIVKQAREAQEQLVARIRREPVKNAA